MTQHDRDVEAVVRSVIADILPDVPASEVTEDRNLRDLGADSVDRVEILSLVLHRLGRTDPLSEFAAVPHLGALFERLGSTTEKKV